MESERIVIDVNKLHAEDRDDTPIAFRVFGYGCLYGVVIPFIVFLFIWAAKSVWLWGFNLLGII